MLKTMPPLDAIEGEIHIWTVALTPPQSGLSALSSLLSPDETARAARFRFACDRERFIVHRAALRQILAAYTSADPRSLDFIPGPYGKPRLAASPLCFSASHSGPLALIALALDCELGIDLEQHRDLNDALALAARFFHPRESQRLAALADPATRRRAFFECWTRKEAFIKALGEGLSHPLDSFEVTLYPDQSPILRHSDGQPLPWQLQNLPPAPNYSAALVYPQPHHPRRIHHQWPPPAISADSPSQP